MACYRMCLPLMLLLSHLVTLAIGLFGTFLSVTDFMWTCPAPSSPTRPRPDQEADGSYSYEDYQYATRRYSRIINDERLYIVIPSVVTVMVGVLMVLRGLHSRQFFNYTHSLYSSLGLWILTLVWIIIYQVEVAWESHLTLNCSGFIMLVQILLILALSAQVLLSMGVLRQQKAGWPTFNWRNIFTVEFLLIVARMTLIVYTVSVLASSQIVNGFSRPDPENPNNIYLGVKFPVALSFTCLAAAAYNAVAIGESLLSMLLGKMNTCINSVTTFVSALCTVIIAVFVSPIFIKKALLPTSYIYLETYYFSIGLCLVTFVHLVACLAFPAISRATPQFILKLPESLISSVRSFSSDQFRPSIFSQKDEKTFLIVNIISSIFATLSIIITIAVWDSPMYRAWGAALALCANSAILVRTLPSIITELHFKQADNTPAIQKVIAMGLESVALLVGGISASARTYYGGEKFAAIINILFVVYQVFMMVQLVKGVMGVPKSDKEVCLSDTEELTSQAEEAENQQISGDDVMA